MPNQVILSLPIHLNIEHIHWMTIDQASIKLTNVSFPYGQEEVDVAVTRQLATRNKKLAGEISVPGALTELEQKSLSKLKNK